MPKNPLAHRMADKTVQLVTRSGDPVAGKEVTIQQTNHKFLFGCVFLMLSRLQVRMVQKIGVLF